MVGCVSVHYLSIQFDSMCHVGVSIRRTGRLVNVLHMGVVVHFSKLANGCCAAPLSELPLCPTVLQTKNLFRPSPRSSRHVCQDSAVLERSTVANRRIRNGAEKGLVYCLLD
jgi:hypothetical protein